MNLEPHHQDPEGTFHLDLNHPASAGAVRVVKLPMGTLYQEGHHVRFVSHDGAVHRLDGRTGEMSSNIPVLRRMEIADLAQVLSHQINRLHQTTSHVIHFVGGGVFTCVYDDVGGLVEMEGRGTRQSTSADGVVTLFGSYVANQDQQ